MHVAVTIRTSRVLQLQGRVCKLEKLEERDALVKVAGVWHSRLSNDQIRESKQIEPGEEPAT